MQAFQAVKLVIVGDSTVGKTAFCYAATQKSWVPETPQVFDNHSLNLTVDGKSISLGVWDTSGSGDYDRLRPLSYPRTDIYVVAFDVNSRSSFKHVNEKWIPEISHHTPNVPFILVGFETDLRGNSEAGEDFVTVAEGSGMVEQLGGTAVAYFECSSRNLSGTQEVLEGAIRAVLNGHPTKSEKKDKSRCIAQ